MEELKFKSELSETEMFKYIQQNVSRENLYEQLMEECCELAQASSKATRYIRGENPPGELTSGEILEQLQEEVTDVILLLELLKLNKIHIPYYTYKLKRWHKRLTDSKHTLKLRDIFKPSNEGITD